LIDRRIPLPLKLLYSRLRAPCRRPAGARVGPATVICWGLALSLIACDIRQDHGLELAERLIEPAADGIFDPTTVFDQRPELSLEFADLKRPERWKQRPAAQLTDEGWLFGHTDKRVRAIGRQRIDTSPIQLVEIGLRPGNKGRLTFEWAAQGEEFAAERRLLAHFKAGDSSVRLPVGEHPLWRGEVRSLRLSVKLATPGEILLRSLTTSSSEPLAERLGKALGRSWKVNIDHDVRSAVLAVPDIAIEHRVTPPEAGRLRVAYGLLPGNRQSARFSLEATSASGSTTLLSADLDPDRPEDAGWHPAEVDLATFAGSPVLLTFRVEMVRGDDPRRTIGAWATPEILGPAATEPPPNVVLISIDTLRPDRMSIYGHHRPTTPRLAAWLERTGASRFLNTIAQGSWTLPSHTSMLSGLNAYHHGVNHNSPAPSSLSLLPELLQPAGYATMALSGGAFVHPSYGLGQGFDRFQYWPGDAGARPQAGYNGNDELDVHLEQARDWIDEHRDRPFFLFFHTYEVHHRISPREPFFGQISDLQVPRGMHLNSPKPAVETGFLRSRELVVRRDGGLEPLPESLSQLPYDIYDSRIAYLDSRLDRLLTHIESLDPRRRTLVVITSDHGELLGEHELFGHLSLYEENVRIPLLLLAPMIDQTPAVIDQQVRTIDIVPTVIDLLGLEIPSWLDGASLRPLLSGEPDDQPRPAVTYAAVSNYGVALRLQNRFKYIFNHTIWRPLQGDEKLFELREDPAEQSNLAAANQQQAEGFYTYLRQVIGEQFPGLRLRLANGGDDPLVATLKGSVIHTSNLKSMDRSGAEVSWLDSSAMQIDLPAGARMEILFEDVKLGSYPLQITLRSGGAGESRHAVEVNGLEWWGIEGQDGTWQLLDHGGQWPITGSFLRWHGRRSEASAAPEESNEELRRRLEALGYL